MSQLVEDLRNVAQIARERDRLLALPTVMEHAANRIKALEAALDRGMIGGNDADRALAGPA